MSGASMAESGRAKDGVGETRVSVWNELKLSVWKWTPTDNVV